MKRAAVGLTLVELLVALALGSILSLSAMQLLLFSTLTSQRDMELARLQENGRYALRLLTRELEMAGFFGASALSPPPGENLQGSSCFNYLLSEARPLQVLNDLDSAGLGQPAHGLPAGCLPGRHHVPGSDAVLVRRSKDRPHLDGDVRFQRPMSGGLYLHVADGELRWREGGGVSGGSLWQYVPQFLFLRDYSITPGDGIPSLCRRRLSPQRRAVTPTECLVEGVESLQIDLSPDGPAADTASVVLVLRTLRPLARSRGSADRFERLRLSSTVSLRNHNGRPL